MKWYRDNRDPNELDQNNIPNGTEQLRVAGILDELSEKFFPYDCNFLNLSANNWEKQIQKFQPHLLFVESVWNGFQKTWRGKFTPKLSLDLIQLVNWCKSRNIPTVFWNKEDPIHMFTFLNVAFLFDHVFTTDLDCVPLYKRLLHHNRVGVLPFASCLQLFNPIETYHRKEAACFAGSYYAKRTERRLAFENLADSVINNYALDIYDRNPYPGNPDYEFPERFQKHIIGTLPADKIQIAYKGYKVGITLNIVNHSSTMEARRIFELLSCNTFTVSNDCLGIKNLFGDTILYFEDPDQFSKSLKKITSDSDQMGRLRLMSLRKILREHTYKERLEYLYTQVFGIKPLSVSPKIAVFSVVKNKKEIDKIRDAFKRQEYQNMNLFLFKYGDEIDLGESDAPIYPIDSFASVLSGTFDSYAYFSPKNYYGKHYIEDLVLSTKYVHVSAIGKSSYFSSLDKNVIFKPEFGSYCYIDRLKLDRCMFAPRLLKTIDEKNLDNFWLECLPCFSIDPYSFCENNDSAICTKVEDIPVKQGVSMSDLYSIAEKIKPDYPNYSLGYVFTGKDIKDSISLPKSSNFHVNNFPTDMFGFYYVGDENSTTKINIDRQIHINDLKEHFELTDSKGLYIYVNASFEGDVEIRANVFNNEHHYLKSFLINPRACTAIPVLDSAEHCSFVILVKGKAYGVINEIIISPKIYRPVELFGNEVVK